MLWRMEQREDYVELGRCGRPHGMRGGLAWRPHSTVTTAGEYSGERAIAEGSDVVLFPLGEGSCLPSEGQDFVVRKIGLGPGTGQAQNVITYLEGIEHLQQAQALVPFSIQLLRKALPPLPPGVFYLADLQGLPVTEYGGEGTLVGTVEGFYHNGAQVVLQIKGEQASYELPFVEAFFPVREQRTGLQMIIPQMTL